MVILFFTVGGRSGAGVVVVFGRPHDAQGTAVAYLGPNLLVVMDFVFSNDAALELKKSGLMRAGYAYLVCSSKWILMVLGYSLSLRG